MKILIVGIVVGTSMLLSSVSYARDSSVESLQLVRLVQELDYLVTQTEQLKRMNQGARLKFNYAALQQDLLRMRELIRKHLELSAQQPNTLTPVANGHLNPVIGNYTSRKKQ